MLENLTAFDIIALLGVAGCIVAITLKSKFDAKDTAEKVEYKIKADLLDKEQTKEISEVKRELDQLKAKN
ncbi:hypothetical protein [Methanocaldococcus sp.]